MLHIPDPHSRPYVYATSWWNADTVDDLLRQVTPAAAARVGTAAWARRGTLPRVPASRVAAVLWQAAWCWLPTGRRSREAAPLLAAPSGFR